MAVRSQILASGANVPMCRILCLAFCFTPFATSADTATHEYFEWLSSRDDTYLVRSYRTDAEIEADIHANQVENRDRPPVYDELNDAARWSMATSQSGISFRDQLHAEFPETVTTGNILAVWEARWDPEFETDLDVLQTHKAFRFDGANGSKPLVEVRTRFTQAPTGRLAKIDGRIYNWSPGAEIQNEALDGEFIIDGGVWTRFWTLIDFNTKNFSLWVADERQRPVLVIDNYRFTSMDPGINLFRYEFNSSQSRSGTKELDIWGRNFVVLRNVEDVGSIIEKGAVVQTELVTPEPPTFLSEN